MSVSERHLEVDFKSRLVARCADLNQSLGNAIAALMVSIFMLWGVTLPGLSYPQNRVPSNPKESTATELRFDELYSKYGVLGLELSSKAKSLAGKSIRVMGYMAPPLKAEAAFFVLMRAPASVCPFCSTDADWPVDIIVVYPRQPGQSLHSATPMAITGRLELGSKIDRETGFVSQVRIVDAELEKLR